MNRKKYKYYKLFMLTYLLSNKYNAIEFNYYISFYDNEYKLIKPSDLTLFNNVHIICNIISNNKTSIIFLAKIYKNKQFNCIQYINIYQKFQLGIKIYIKNKPYNKTIFFAKNNNIDYNILKFKNDNYFNPLLINKEYLILNKNINEGEINQNISDNLKFKKIYLEKPIFLTLTNSSLKENIWEYKKIYYTYFCFCKGANCFYYNISKECKYRFYLNIIDENKSLYNKTDYLLADFFFAGTSSDDAFPIFEEMIKQNMSAHYMDEKKSLYNRFCSQERHCLKIIQVINGNIYIDGDFLEKYLDLILRLKAVIAGGEFPSFKNIFKYIDYITYINLGHGIKYFKHFLYKDYSSYKKYNKILLPPSQKIIFFAKKYGWNDDNIIKNCLPKWDKYDFYWQNNQNNSNRKKSIFILFTWRLMKNITSDVSPYYIRNIIKLINNNELNMALKKKNITFYFSLHHMLSKYKEGMKSNKIYFIEQNEISDCLTKTNLLISDFSSVIFDMIYQKKPYIIYIPDSEDQDIKNLYIQGYYDIINGLKNGSIYFENKFFNIKETINKIIYYINNNFLIDSNLSKFYESFELNCKNNTKNFINYLKSI